MAKRTVAALVVVVTVLAGGPAGAAGAPLWPCEVTVWVEPGRLEPVASVAVDQLDAATVMSWPLVADPAEAAVVIGWEDLEPPLGGLASVSADDVAKVAAKVSVDPSTPNRWLMSIVLHEVGHVAGLDHNDEARSVMNLGDVPWRSFQAADLDALAGVTCG